MYFYCWSKPQMCLRPGAVHSGGWSLWTYSGQRFCHVTRCLSSCRWLCSSTSRTKMSSRSFMRRCWPNVWSIRTAPATTRRPAWSPNSRWGVTQSACIKNTHSNSEHVRFLSTQTEQTSALVVVQQACGFEYTSKLQRMFQDIGVSKDLNEQFKKHLTNSEPLDCKYTLRQQSRFVKPLTLTVVLHDFQDWCVLLLAENLKYLKWSELVVTAERLWWSGSSYCEHEQHEV